MKRILHDDPGCGPHDTLRVGAGKEDHRRLHSSDAEGADGGSRRNACGCCRACPWRQDPHFVTPTPVLMSRTRDAALFVENGFSLELWADEVVNGSGNSKIARGSPGRVVATTGIAALEIPSVLSREMGDIHPQGNPHVWLDPLLAKQEAGNIAEALKRVDPAGAAYYDQRKADSKTTTTPCSVKNSSKLVGIQKLTRLVQTGELAKLSHYNEARRPATLRKGGRVDQAGRSSERHKGVRVSQGLGLFRQGIRHEIRGNDRRTTRDSSGTSARPSCYGPDQGREDTADPCR